MADTGSQRERLDTQTSRARETTATAVSSIEAAVSSIQMKAVSSVPMKIVVADDLPESALELLRAEGWYVDAKSGRPATDLAAVLADADALLVRSSTKVTQDLLAQARCLRVVGRAGTGVDNID